MHSRPEEMVQRHKLLDLLNLFEIYPQSMFVDLVVSLHILVSHDTTWTQTDHIDSPRNLYNFLNTNLLNNNLLYEVYISLEVFSVLLFKVPNKYFAKSVIRSAIQNFHFFFPPKS